MPFKHVDGPVLTGADFRRIGNESLIRRSAKFITN
jgi:hypothetical protein